MKAFVEVNAYESKTVDKMKTGEVGVLTCVPDYEDEDRRGDPILHIGPHVFFFRSGDYIPATDTCLKEFEYRPLAVNETIVITE